MKLFQDVFTKKDMASDAYKYTIEYGGTILAFEGKCVLEEIRYYDDMTQEETVKPVAVVDIVQSGKLAEIPTIHSKKSFKEEIKKMTGRLVNHVLPERREEIKAPLATFVQDVLKDYEQYSFYAGDRDEYDLEGGFALLRWNGIESKGMQEGDELTLYLFKDAVESIKC